MTLKQVLKDARAVPHRASKHHRKPFSRQPKSTHGRQSYSCNLPIGQWSPRPLFRLVCLHTPQSRTRLVTPHPEDKPTVDIPLQL
jgi:hypothetical protein